MKDILNPKIVFGGAATLLLLLALHRPFDYDEVLLAHQSWLISKGFVPFQDFHAVHPPFFAYLFAPLLSIIPENFESMVFLRLANLPFALFALFFIGKTYARIIDSPNRTNIVMLSLSFFLIAPMTLDILSEFRRDALSLVFSFWAYSIYVQKIHAVKIKKQTAFYIGLLFALGLAVDAKLPLLPIAAFGFIFMRQGIFPLLFTLLGFTVGISVSATMLFAFDIPLLDFLNLTYRFHAAISGQLSDSTWFIQKFVEKTSSAPLLWLPTAAGIVYALKTISSHSQRPVVVPLLVSFLALFFLNKLPSRQYIVLIYLVNAGFLVLFLQWLAGTSFSRIAIRGAIALLCIHAVWASANFYGSWNSQRQRHQIAFGNELLALTDQNETVVAAPPGHPVFRRDSLYSTVFTYTPGRLTMESLLNKMPQYSTRFSAAGYLSQLDSHPPKIIVFAPTFQDDNLLASIKQYLELNADKYQSIMIGPTTAYLRKRSN